jgi:hypothetical protein
MHAHTFMPVNGRFPLWGSVDDVVPLEDGLEVPVAGVDGAFESDELLLDEELLELELDEEGELLG